MGWLADRRAQNHVYVDLHQLRDEAAVEAMTPTTDYETAVRAWDRHDLLDQAISDRLWTRVRADDDETEF